ncbi:MAG: PD-(D/E)XK nuclease family protein [Gammaproteobacteria bacterium]|nr:PD-(D/E)XK nuclease family protein [Gammaproteobacteria bacterium]
MPKNGTANPINANSYNADGAPPWWRHALGENGLALLARQILARCGGQLPNWSDVAVIVPHTSLATPLRRQLVRTLQQSGRNGAFVGLTIHTLRGFVEQHSPPLTNTVPLAAHELLLVEALRQHPSLFNHGNPWSIASDLMRLFEQLTLYQCELPASLQAFENALRNAYGDQLRTHPGLEREATLVHTLWQASKTQLAATQSLDSHAAYLLRLAQCLQPTHAQWRFFVLPDPRWSRVEQQWVEVLAQQGRAEVFLLGQGQEDAPPSANPLPLWQRLLAPAPPSDNTYTAFWNAAFAPEHTPSLRERAQRFAYEYNESPLQGRVQLCAAPNPELEARAIELQLRLWRAEGLQHLCVITDDRHLARRLRALLERSGITLNDYSGWALSTTRAAALLERWLECIENDFEFSALLDVVHSPFVGPAAAREAWQTAAYRLDHDIIRHENIHRGLERYRKHLHLRLQRVHHQESETYLGIASLLDTLQQAAAPLLALRRTDKGHTLGEYLPALMHGLETLHARTALENDAAGARVLEELQAWLRPNTPATVLTWPEFRTLIGRTIERYNFIPAHTLQGVTLLGLAQSLYHTFDGLILAGVTLEKLPGAAEHSSFFNQRVRLELGLPTAATHQGQRLYHFLHALHAAPRLLLTWHQNQTGDAIISPWVECIETFHRLAYTATLHHPSLIAWALAPQSEVCARVPLPPPSAQPSPSLPESLRPTRYSARSHQHLIDCPYQFFARHGLRLERPERVREVMSKADQGELIHRCLHAFHQALPGLPGPWRGAYKDATKPAAIELLTLIADALYANAVEDNFEHRGWLTAWRNAIPLYIDWQWQRAQVWQVHAMEQKLRRELQPACDIDGRLDRIDRNAAGFAIIDFKTGSIPSTLEISTGEAIQLTHYALALADPTQIQRVEYLQIDHEKVASQRVLEGDDLATATQYTSDRLQQMHQAIANQAPLPAWGDAHTCARCDLNGVCRRVQWSQ